MENYYIAEFRVIVDGQDYSIEVVSGTGFDLNFARGTAETKARQENPGKKVAAVLIKREDMTYENYLKIIGEKPYWFRGSNEESNP